ncbi:hypothetical protein GA0070622_1223 [Micromonospora sediminicola]|uniref:Uncharacterized protein n=1 Tax=Micromonospora sediminicola TaxID=946078 RepID=A0A1A9B576_9ACTN|nr:hypothetical protein [Micromonospora sediminicola]SBT64253.1 hypothetical protein GA0070622_1223 [Micromonospora sediminicola]
MLTRHPAAAALAAALAVLLGTAALTLAVPDRPSPTGLGALIVLAVLWLATAAVCAAVALRRARTADWQRLHAAAYPLYRRGEPAAFLDIPEAHR